MAAQNVDCPNAVEPEDPKAGAVVLDWEADPAFVAFDPRFENAPKPPLGFEKLELPPPNAPKPFAGWIAVPPKPAAGCVDVTGGVPNAPNIVFVRSPEEAVFELPSDRPPMLDSLSASTMSASGEAAGGVGAAGDVLLNGALEPKFEGVCEENELNPNEGLPNDEVVEANAPKPDLAGKGDGCAGATLG